jgi:hypothetical protein
MYCAAMRYAVTPVAQTDCDCPDCRAGSHLYELNRWQNGQWQFVGVSLQSYASAEDCKQRHYWGIEFQTGDIWEDGAAILPLEGT